NGAGNFWNDGDLISRTVGLLMLAMSVGSWVVILWKAWLLRRAGGDVQRGVAAFWSAATIADGRARLQAIDREALLLPLVDAMLLQPVAGTLETQPALASQLTRRLRDALHAGLAQLQFGQVVLASVGSTAPFIGLFGTVWGIFHALAGMAEGNGMTIAKIAAPVGEALIFTAAGLAVAIPAVLAYNIFGKRISACEADLEGFAHDLREMRLDATGGGR
ncbi:MAG: MotA/TolQ/ExbB proton channel family protein, partial [Burkholderiaceae bacterium]